MKSDMATEFDRVTESLKIQNENLIEAVNNGTNETTDNIDAVVTNMTVILDKIAYNTDRKMTKINQRMEEHIYQTESVSFIIIMDQLDKKQKELAQVLARIAQLNQTIPKLSDKCLDKHTCYDCLQDEACGWCSMEDKCVQGDDRGPKLIACNFYSYKQCSGRQCHKYTTCSTCLSDPACGWCIDDIRYVSGCIQQPADYQGCSQGGWFHLEGSQKRCPKALAKLYSEDYDENAYWEKPQGTYLESGTNFEQAQEDKANALTERGAKQEEVSSVELNAKQEGIKKQIDLLVLQSKEIKKQIKALQKKYDETAAWLKKFKDGGQSQEEEEAEAPPPEPEPEKPKDPKEIKKEKLEQQKKAKEEKKKLQEEEKKKKEEQKKKEKEKKDAEKKKKQQEDEAKKKAAKDAKNKKPAEAPAKEADPEDPQEEEKPQEEQKQQEQNKKEPVEWDAKKEKTQSKKSDTSKKGSTSKQTQQGDSASNESEDKPERPLPKDYFREKELKQSKFEDLYADDEIPNADDEYEYDIESDELEFDEAYSDYSDDEDLDYYQFSR